MHSKQTREKVFFFLRNKENNNKYNNIGNCEHPDISNDKEEMMCHTTSASIRASITVDGAYFAAYPYMRAKAACISSDSSVLKLSEKKDKNLQWMKSQTI